MWVIISSLIVVSVVAFLAQLYCYSNYKGRKEIQMVPRRAMKNTLA